jgi:hypothetical protein
MHAAVLAQTCSTPFTMPPQVVDVELVVEYFVPLTVPVIDMVVDGRETEGIGTVLKLPERVLLGRLDVEPGVLLDVEVVDVVVVTVVVNAMYTVALPPLDVVETDASKVFDAAPGQVNRPPSTLEHDVMVVVVCTVVVCNVSTAVLRLALLALSPMKPSGLDDAPGRPADIEVEAPIPRDRLGRFADNIGTVIGSDVLGAVKTPCATLKSAPAVAERPGPIAPDTPALMPDEPMLTPMPSEAPTESDALAVTDAPTLRMVLDDGPFTVTPALRPRPGLVVAPIGTQPFSGSPPFAQVVTEMLFVVRPEKLETAEEIPPLPTDTDTDTIGVMLGEDVMPFNIDETPLLVEDVGT